MTGGTFNATAFNGPIGGTPNTGAFTTLSATDNFTATKNFNGSLIFSLTNANAGNATYTNYQLIAGTATAAFNVTGSGTTTVGRYIQGHLLIDSSGDIDSAIAGSIISTLSSTGLAVSGSISPSGSAVTWTAGSGSPEGAVTAVVGSIYSRTNGGANTSFYVKESGSGNTGWVAK